MAELERLGARPSDIEGALAARKPSGENAQVVEVWQENVESFDIFCKLGTQWRVASGFAAVRTGLIYSEAVGYMRELRLKRERRLEILGDLMAMERAAIEAWNEQAAEAGG